MITNSLVEYILWMSDFPIAVTGLREPDILILGALAYVDFAPIFHATPVQLQACAAEPHRFRVCVVGHEDNYLPLLAYAAKSRRFGELWLEDYADVYEPTGPVQFSAVTFSDHAAFHALAYRGTDSSLAGWKEDFMMSFTRTRAALLAADYAAAHLSRGDRSYYMLGHSKGGHLALYAACSLDDTCLQRVQHVYTLDGPGLCTDLAMLQRVAPLVTSIQPVYSIVGKLFEAPIPDSRIVRSSAMGFGQHMIFTWRVAYGKLAYAQAHDAQSVALSAILKKWIDNMSVEDRTVFIDELFDVLRAGGATTLEDFSHPTAREIEELRRRFQGTSEITRRVIADLPRQVLLSLTHRS